MKLVKYSPFSEIQKMEHDMDRLMANAWSLPSFFADTTALDMYEEDGKLITELALPNFNKDEVAINADGNILEIKAEHKSKEESDDKRRYFVRESSNYFFRRIVLPEGANEDKIEASMQDGKLTIAMPMKAKKQIKPVKVK